MANRRAIVTQGEISRALKAARNAGYSVIRFEISADDGLRVYIGDTDSTEASNEWDVGLGLS